MSEVIYHNNFKLDLINKQTESCYQSIKEKELLKIKLPIFLVSFLITIGVGVFQSFYFDNFNKENFLKFNFIMTLLTWGVQLLIIPVLCISKNIKLIRYANYVIFYTQIFVLIALRYTMVVEAKVYKLLVFFEYLFEIIVRLMWVFLSLQSFLESFILNGISLITVWIIVPLLFPDSYYQEEMINTLAYSFVLIGIISIAYLVERKDKTAFYLLSQAQTKIDWLTNIFDNLNSALVTLKDGKIIYINSYFRKHFKKIYTLKNILTERMPLINFKTTSRCII
jgi:hypothetical protein